MKRYSPRLTGIDKQVVQQILDKGLMKVIMTPILRSKVREEFGCTNEDIDRAILAGEAEFGNEFKQMLAKQRAEMVPPPEDDNDENA